MYMQRKYYITIYMFMDRFHADFLRVKLELAAQSFRFKAFLIICLDSVSYGCTYGSLMNGSKNSFYASPMDFEQTTVF